jgi:hypothetical protein
MNYQRLMHPYLQNPLHGSPRVVLVRPVYNISAASPIPSIYEAPPPSYEIAIADLPPKYESVPVTEIVEQMDTRL